MAVEYPSLVDVLTTDTFEEWRVKTNKVKVYAEAVAANIGNLAFLETDAQSTIVDAINEVNTHTDINTRNIGNMSTLDPQSRGWKKDNLVDTINAENQWSVEYTDTEVGKERDARIAADNALQAELDVTQNAAGLNADGTYSLLTTATYVPAAASLRQGISLLDTTLKTKSDLLDRLNITVGGGAVTGQFNYDGLGVNYLTTDSDNNAVVKTNLVELDGAVKINEDDITVLESRATRLETVQDFLKYSVGTNTNGVYVAAVSNEYAIHDTVKENINTLDSTLKLLSDEVYGSLKDRVDNIETDLDTKEDKSIVRGPGATDVDPLGNLNSGVGDTTSIVAAINALYQQVLPLITDHNAGGYVKKTGDTMSGTLTINGADLKVTGNQSLKIECSGDIIAFQV
jgi:hypothetical protein